jgi:replicative DNA helicase
MTATQLWNADAEQATLGAMLLSATAIAVAGDMLTAGSFALAAHQRLFAAIVAVAQSGAVVDHITLRDELIRRGELEQVGGLASIVDLLDAVPTAAYVAHHAAIVQDYATRRALAAEAQAALALAHDRGQPIGPSVASVVDRLVRTGLVTAERRVKPIRTELQEVLDEVEAQARHGDTVPGIPSGIGALDQITDGWAPGRLIVVAARPKVGKTGFGLYCAREACRADAPVFFATAEQPQRELVKRMVAIESGCNLRAVTSETVLGMVVPELARAASAIATWPIAIDQVSRTPAQLRLRLQRHVAEHGPIGLVVVDYLGKYHSGQKTERHDLEIARMTGAFAELAMDLNVPVLLLVQLNRQSVQGGQSRRPTPADLRDSGAIEQDAAQVLFLYRDEKAEQAQRDPRWMQVLVELNRFGPTGDVEVRFERETGRWARHLRIA